MTIELLKPIEANGKVIPEGTIIRISSPEVTEKMVREGIGRPVNLADTMDEILQQTVRDIQAGGSWKATPQVREIESASERIYREVIAGSKTIEAFRNICLQWKNAGAQDPETRYENTKEIRKARSYLRK